MIGWKERADDEAAVPCSCKLSRPVFNACWRLSGLGSSNVGTELKASVSLVVTVAREMPSPLPSPLPPSSLRSDGDLVDRAKRTVETPSADAAVTAPTGGGVDTPPVHTCSEAATVASSIDRKRCCSSRPPSSPRGA